MVHHHFLEDLNAEHLYASRILASSTLYEINEGLYCPVE
jgi:hypothetical protein